MSCFIGFARGFIRELLNLVTWIAAFIVASFFSKPLALIMMNSSALKLMMNSASASGASVATQSLSHFATGFAYSIVFVGTMLVGSLLAYVINLASYGMGFGLGNRLMGALFGFIKGLILVLISIFMAQLTPISKQLIFKKSMIVQICQPMTTSFQSWLSPSIAHFKSELNHNAGEVSSVLNKIQIPSNVSDDLSKSQADTEK